MFEEILSKVEQTIQSQLQERFGIDAEQSKNSFNVVKENLNNIFSKGLNPQDLMSNLSNLENSETIQNLKQTVLGQLQDKVGLSADLAQKVNDFSLAEIMKSFSAEIMGEDGKPDIQKILSKFNFQDLQKAAGGILGNLFNKG